MTPVWESDEELAAFHAPAREPQRQPRLTVADIVIDTDVASALLKRQAPKCGATQLPPNPGVFTFSTVGEHSKRRSSVGRTSS